MSRLRTPGSIHEGGELGLLAVCTPTAAALDNPDLLAPVRGGRRRKPETGPAGGELGTPTSSSNPAIDGAVVARVASQRLQDRKIRRWLARISHDELRALAGGLRLCAPVRRGLRPPRRCISSWRRRLIPCSTRDRPASRANRRASPARSPQRPRWPMIVLKTPKGWTGTEGGRRPADGGHGFAHTRSPLAAVRTNPEHLAQLESWMRSYAPEELFDESGAGAGRGDRASLRKAEAPDERQTLTPNGGLLTRPARIARLPRTTPSTCRSRRETTSEATRVAGHPGFATSSAPTRIASGSWAPTRRSPTA